MLILLKQTKTDGKVVAAIPSVGGNLEEQTDTLKEFVVEHAPNPQLISRLDKALEEICKSTFMVEFETAEWRWCLLKVGKLC